MKICCYLFLHNSVNYYIWLSCLNISRPLVINTIRELRPELINNDTSHSEYRPDLLGL